MRCASADAAAVDVVAEACDAAVVGGEGGEEVPRDVERPEREVMPKKHEIGRSRRGLSDSVDTSWLE